MNRYRWKIKVRKHKGGKASASPASRQAGTPLAPQAAPSAPAENGMAIEAQQKAIYAILGQLEVGKG